MNELFVFMKELAETYLAMAPYLVLGLCFAGVLHVFFRREFVEKHLGGHGFVPVLKATLLGVPLPLCSCGVVPTALSLRRSRASDGATVSFLISTPVTGADSILATYGMMGPVFAIFRPLAAFFMGIAGGMVADAGSTDTEKTLEGVKSSCPVCGLVDDHRHGIYEKISAMYHYAFVEFLDDIAVNLLIGFIAAAAISILIPADLFTVFRGNVWLEMLVALIGGIPLYVCATASIPIAAALMLKGLSPAAAFVFLAAGPATNAATLILIWRSMGSRITVIYLSVIAIGSIVFGRVLQEVYRMSGGFNPLVLPCHHHENLFTINFSSLVAVAFLVPFGISITGRFRAWFTNHWSRQKPSSPETDNSAQHYTVGGMNCSKCVAHVSKAVGAIECVNVVKVDLSSGDCSVEGSFADEAVITAVAEAGYTIIKRDSVKR